MRACAGRGATDELVIVDRALQRCVAVPQIAPTLQAALDRWAETEPLLRAAAAQFESGGAARAQQFDPRGCMAPLPRAYQWLDGSAYLHHVELVRRARGAEMPASFLTDPLMYQGGSDALLGPRDEAAFVSEEHGIDLEAEVAIITDDVPARHQRERGRPPREAHRARQRLEPAQSDSRRACQGVRLPAVEAGHGAVGDCGDARRAWRAPGATGKVHLPLVSSINGTLLGRPNAGVDMNFSFYELLAHAARTRQLAAGTILGSGTVANRDPASGCSCLAERRTLEVLEYGSARTPFLKFGERVRIEMLAENGEASSAPSTSR